MTGLWRSCRVARMRPDLGITLRTRVWATWTKWRVLNAQHASICRHDGHGALCWLCKIAEYEADEHNNDPARDRPAS